MTHRIKNEALNAGSNNRQSKPLYFAVEIDGEAGVFRCPALGAFHYSQLQLLEWAEWVDCELRLIRWSDCER